VEAKENLVQVLEQVEKSFTAKKDSDATICTDARPALTSVRKVTPSSGNLAWMPLEDADGAAEPYQVAISFAIPADKTW
jgi:hypothetical protein